MNLVPAARLLRMFLEGGLADRGPSPDWVVVDARRLQLRAERSGTGTGRVYTLTVTCGDASGNLATRQLAVTVPKNQR